MDLSRDKTKFSSKNVDLFWSTEAESSSIVCSTVFGAAERLCSSENGVYAQYQKE